MLPPPPGVELAALGSGRRRSRSLDCLPFSTDRANGNPYADPVGNQKAASLLASRPPEVRRR
nr:MAG TPA_asm: hypothetical protein [Caudoviricetes sp.]